VRACTCAFSIQYWCMCVLVLQHFKLGVCARVRMCASLCACVCVCVLCERAYPCLPLCVWARAHASAPPTYPCAAGGGRACARRRGARARAGGRERRAPPRAAPLRARARPGQSPPKADPSTPADSLAAARAIMAPRASHVCALAVGRSPSRKAAAHPAQRACACCRRHWAAWRGAASWPLAAAKPLARLARRGAARRRDLRRHARRRSARRRGRRRRRPSRRRSASVGGAVAVRPIG
jgi:hypothetical protein